ncbi:unnamed protein product, partial [marine sediment metagenome]
GSITFLTKLGEVPGETGERNGNTKHQEIQE